MFDPENSPVEMNCWEKSRSRAGERGPGHWNLAGAAALTVPLSLLSPSFLHCTTSQKLRQELDDLLQEKIENPHPVDWAAVRSRDTAVLTAIIDLITTQENEAVRNFAPRFQGERYS